MIATARRPVVVLGFALVVFLAACGSSSSSKSKSSNSSTSSTTAAAPAAAPSTTGGNPLASAPPPGDHFATTISFVKLPNNGGLILVGPNGHSLYVFDKDHGTTSACTGACSQLWPPLKSSGTPTVASGLDASKAATASSGQVTYNGHLLYYFAPDQAPGDTNGVSIPNWHVVSPLGTAMTGR
jgi:predicted lipoprotein with Yx(FWY)xxD motif